MTTRHSPVHLALLALAVLRGCGEFAQLQRWRIHDWLRRLPTAF